MVLPVAQRDPGVVQKGPLRVAKIRVPRLLRRIRMLLKTCFLVAQKDPRVAEKGFRVGERGP